MFKIHTKGDWKRGTISVQVVPSTRRIVPEVEAAIDEAWREGQERLGARLFDGPMCRIEGWSATDSLSLQLSLTSYRIFYGTNLNPKVSDRFRSDVCANPVGISSGLQTQDDWLLFGKRNSTVAYYPDRVHPFAGALEEKDLSDVFGSVERELHEELRLSPADIVSICCIGIAEDQTIRHPELIFRTRVKLTRGQIEAQIHHDEHGGSVAIHVDPDAIEEALLHPGEFTPIAIATLQLFRMSLA
jgi:hypothetical protein